MSLPISFDFADDENERHKHSAKDNKYFMIENFASELGCKDTEKL